LDNLSILSAQTIRIQEVDPLDEDSIWPNQVEVCITRIPIRKRDGFSIANIEKLAKKLKTSVVKNGIVFLICYAPVEDKARPFEVARAMTKAGFTHIDNIVIEKSWYPGKRSEKNLVNSHEYVLHFCNGKVWSLDRLPIREYLSTDSDVSCPGNTWQIETGSLDEAYPVDLAELLLRMTDLLPGSIVFDPYCGTSSSLTASIKLSHSFYGFETDKRKLKKYNKIIEEIKEKADE